jgi:hypothetical protein
MQIPSYVLSRALDAGNVAVTQVDQEYRNADGQPGLAIRFADLHDLVVACLGFGAYVPPAVRETLNEHLAVYLEDGSVKLVAHGVSVSDVGFDSMLTEVVAVDDDDQTATPAPAES